MLIYIIIFLIIAILGFNSLNKPKVEKHVFFTITLLLSIFVGISDMLGGFDRYIYAQAYEAQSELIETQFMLMPYFWNEPGYGLLNVAIGLFTPNRYIFIFITTIIIYALLSFNIYKYSRYPFLSLFLFMGIMFAFTFTYLRQILAAGVLWYTIPYIRDRKFWKFFMLVLLAASFHNSAIIFILTYFIPLRLFKIKNIIIIMFLLFLIGVSGLSSKIFALYGDALGDVVEKATRYEKTSNYGFRFEYLLESVIFLILLLTNYDRLTPTKETCIKVNIYLLFCGSLLFFISNSDGGRLSWYFFIGIFTILPIICAISKNRLISPVILILFSVLYIRILFSWTFLLYPYKTFFTNGYRENDKCYLEYEYDHNYDYDKFYNL